MKLFWLALFCACCALSLGARAKDAPPLAADPAVEQRMVVITEELRCLVCQNESLAASQADLAKDLRREVRELVKAGKTDAEIRDYLVARYGDFVLYRPPLKPVTWLLWLGPFALLALGVAALFWHLRRRKTELERELTAAEKARAEAMFRGDAL